MTRLGLAVDIGTTNIAGFIINLDKPKDRFYTSLRSGQTVHGFDVISRLTFVSAGGDTEKLRKLLVNDINNLIHVLTKKIKVNRKRIERIVVSANTVILHFLFGLDTSGLATHPYSSLLKGMTTTSAKELGIVAGLDAQLTALPVISPFVGADAVAGVIYTNMDKLSSVKLLIDLGTNAEIVLGNKDRLLCTSAAAGPAFKSKNIPLGSEMISLIAKGLREGWIDHTGKINERRATSLPASLREALQAGDQRLSQDDIRAFQLAKGAIRAAIQILLDRMGITIDKVDKILLSGLFGEKIDRADAMETGLIPDVDRTKVRAIGNSSLEGAKQVLLQPKIADRAAGIASKSEHVELSLDPSYQELYISFMNF